MDQFKIQSFSDAFNFLSDVSLDLMAGSFKMQHLCRKALFLKEVEVVCMNSCCKRADLSLIWPDSTAKKTV